MATAAEIAQIFLQYGAGGKTQADYDRIAYQVSAGIRSLADVELWARHLAAGTTPTTAELAAVGTTDTSGYASQPRGTQLLNSIPEGDQAQIWQTTDGQYYVVFYVPGTDVPLMYSASASDVQTMFGTDQAIVVNRVGTMASFVAAGGLIAGDAVELNNLTENPFIAWVSQVEAQAETRPWLLDEEVLNLLAEALLEGRDVAPAEFEGTNWWQTRNEGERQWALLSLSDPMEAARLMSSNTISIEDSLEAAGIHNPGSELINLLTNQFTTGKWDNTYLTRQIEALADPYKDVILDPLLASFRGNIDTTRKNEQTVTDLVNKWLGPLYGNWNADPIKVWASRITNDPDATMNLTEMLQAQRVAMFPEYQDRTLTYEDIAAPWRQVWEGIWGQVPDETDPLFTQVVKLNDAAEASKILRGEGLKRGVKQVVNNVASAIGTVQPGVRSAF